MQQFSVRVETHIPGHRPFGDVFDVKAKDEMAAGEVAKLQARDKHEGGTPLVRGIRPAGTPWEVNPETNATSFNRDPGEAPKVVSASTTETQEGIRDYDAPKPKAYAEWKKMPWFTLKKYAFHASRIQPKDKTEALVMLQERGLVSA